MMNTSLALIGFVGTIRKFAIFGNGYSDAGYIGKIGGITINVVRFQNGTDRIGS